MPHKIYLLKSVEKIPFHHIIQPFKLMGLAWRKGNNWLKLVGLAWRKGNILAQTHGLGLAWHKSNNRLKPKPRILFAVLG